MTGRYVTTQTSIYTDPDLRHWKPLTLFLYRYLYENDHVHGVTGIGRIAMETIQHETRMTETEVGVAIEQIGDRVMWFEDQTYWVVGRAKHTCFKRDGQLNPKLAQSALTIIRLQCDELQQAFSLKYPILYQYPINTPDIPYRAVKNLPDLPTEAVAVAVAVAEADKEKKHLTSTPAGVEGTVPDTSEDESQQIATDHDIPAYQMFSFTWNRMAAKCGLPCVQELSDKRKKALKARWTNKAWREGWEKAIAKIPGCSFLLGDGSRNWRANFDWFIRPDSVTKLMEGLYDGSGPAPGGRDWDGIFD